MTKTMTQTIQLSVTLLVLISAHFALANDCGLETLTVEAQAKLNAGEMVMLTSEADAGDKDSPKSTIQMWSYSKNSSLTETVANWYDFGTYMNAGGVADIALANGEKASNNPAYYKVTPKPTNPFGALYQPFTYEARVRVDGSGYNLHVDYQTSPGLIKHVFNNICATKINDRVLVRFVSTITDSENPMLSKNGSVFDWSVRKQLWGSVFMGDILRVAKPASSETVENLKKALLGSFGK